MHDLLPADKNQDPEEDRIKWKGVLRSIDNRNTTFSHRKIDSHIIYQADILKTSTYYKMFWKARHLQVPEKLKKRNETLLGEAESCTSVW